MSEQDSYWKNQYSVTELNEIYGKSMLDIVNEKQLGFWKALADRFKEIIFAEEREMYAKLYPGVEIESVYHPRTRQTLGATPKP